MDLLDDVDSSATVVLDDLVGSLVSTTTDNPSLIASRVVLHGDGILADVLKPNELEGAGAVAVDTLSLVLADDDVAEGGTGL